jgi:hypothetical protein
VAWGSDPLEYYGGFPSLIPNKQDRYPSSIAPEGGISWSNIESKTITKDHSANVSLSVSFPQVDWPLLQSVYGWAATQYQAWARGEVVLTAESAQNVILWTNNVVEFAVDGVRHFGGDYFAFRKAPLVLRLEPGRHVIDLRLVRDVRAMGGIGVPTIDIAIELRISITHLEVRERSVLISDVVDGRLASPYGSVSVTNTGTRPISIVDVIPTNVSNPKQLNLLFNCSLIKGIPRYPNSATANRRDRCCAWPDSPHCLSHIPI